MSYLAPEHSSGITSQATASSGEGAAPSRGARPVLLIIGDSIALGATAIDGTTILSRVENSFADHAAASLPEWSVVVEAAPLRTTRFAATSTPEAITRHRPDAIFVTTGANDVDIDWRRFMFSQGRTVQSRTPLSAYAASLRAIAGHGRAAGIPVILADTFNSNLDRRMGHLCSILGQDIRSWVEGAGGQPVCDAMVREYRAAAASVARELGLALCPLGSSFEQGDLSSLLAQDGTHPNQAGHDLLASVANATLTQVLPTRKHMGVA